MQRIHYETLPSDICCLFQINANRHEHNTRHKWAIPIPLCRKHQQLHTSFLYTGPKLLSTLSTTAKTSKILYFQFRTLSSTVNNTITCKCCSIDRITYINLSVQLFFSVTAIYIFICIQYLYNYVCFASLCTYFTFCTGWSRHKWLQTPVV